MHSISCVQFAYNCFLLDKRLEDPIPVFKIAQYFDPLQDNELRRRFNLNSLLCYRTILIVYNCCYIVDF